jgi:PKD repeat protein
MAVVGCGLFAGVALADPPARFAVSDDEPRVNQEVLFGAFAECGDPVVCTWDFGDGATATGRIVRHAYATEGRKIVTLTVDDQDPEDPPSQRSGRIDVQGDPSPPPDPPPPPPPPPPPANEKPSAAFMAPDRAQEGEAVQFDARGSRDPDGDAIGFGWDFGDGTTDGNTATPKHVFAKAGTYIVRLTIQDARGARDQTTRKIEIRSVPVRVNARPNAGIAVSDGSPMSGQAVTLSSTSRDADGSIAALGWDVDGNGFNDGGGPSLSVAFAVPGGYQVRLKAIDNEGAESVASIVVRVRNRKPTAAFDYEPKFVAKDKPVDFTSRSSDPEGRLGGYRWDLDGDGRFDDAQGATARATYKSEKPVSVGLQVSDRDGGSAERRLQIVPGNRAPTATILSAPDPPQPGAPATLTAQASDPDGTVASLAWDVDDDGEFDDGTTAQVTWTFPVAGPHRVSLRVTDNSGSSNVVVRQLAVGATAGVPTVAAGPARNRASLLSPFPVIRIAGRLTRRGAHLRLVSVAAPRGARIAASCRGRGCVRRAVVAKAKGSRKVRRLKDLQRSYRAGARIVIRVTRRGRIGKYTRIEIRKGRKPARVDRCLMPGARRPTKCPR